MNQFQYPETSCAPTWA